jgi:hypothetical protein
MREAAPRHLPLHHAHGKAAYYALRQRVLSRAEAVANLPRGPSGPILCV